jgi:hypothetical protein
MQGSSHSNRRRIALALGAALVVALAVAGVYARGQPRVPEPRRANWSTLAAGPAQSLRVYWVGHSLMNCRDSHLKGSLNLMEMVGQLAAASGGVYDSFDHTLFGSPLSLLWRGRPVSYNRSEPELVERRRKLLDEGSRFDALVLTEGIPVERSLEREHSAFFAQEFYCALVTRNPRARVYVYESWSHLHASDPEGGYPAPSAYDWPARLVADRKHWERLADLAGTGAIQEPGAWPRLKRALGVQSEGCAPQSPLFLVPVGTVFVRLAERLKNETWIFDGRPLAPRDLFSNPYETWPAGWPLREPLDEAAEKTELARLRKRHSGDLDDIHSSDLGVYVTSLVHYATLYRRSPVGLPTQVRGLGDETKQKLQELVWEVVRSEPRTGVKP